MKDRVHDIKANFDAKETAELISVWTANDRTQYADEAFDAIRLILSERGVELPA